MFYDFLFPSTLNLDLRLGFALEEGIDYSRLLWCLCSCFREARQRSPFDKKYDSCRRILYTSIHISTLTLGL